MAENKAATVALSSQVADFVSQVEILLARRGVLNTPKSKGVGNTARAPVTKVLTFCFVLFCYLVSECECE